MTQMTKIELELPLYDYTTKKGEIHFGIVLKLRRDEGKILRETTQYTEAFSAYSLRLIG